MKTGRWKRWLAVSTCSLLTGCGGFGVYKIDIQQGNLVTQEQMARVRVGMSRSEVRSILGTPLLQDPFHADRWDYYFSDDRGSSAGPFGRDQQKFLLTISFDNDKVASIVGDASPEEIMTGGGERRKTPNFTPPNAPQKPSGK